MRLAKLSQAPHARLPGARQACHMHSLTRFFFTKIEALIICHNYTVDGVALMAKAHVCDHDMMKKILGTKDHLKGHDKMTMDAAIETKSFFLSFGFLLFSIFGDN